MSLVWSSGWAFLCHLVQSTLNRMPQSLRCLLRVAVDASIEICILLRERLRICAQRHEGSNQ